MTSTRERLLDAALRAFATRGVDGTPITDLEEAAGLAPGSGGFYRYFGSKDDALVAVIDREVERIERRHPNQPPDRAATSGDPRLALAVACSESLTIMRSIGPLIALLAREHDRIPDLGDQVAAVLVGAGIERDAMRMSEWMAEGRIAGDDPVALGAVMLSAIVGYHLTTEYFGAPPAGVDRDRFITALVDLVAPA